MSPQEHGDREFLSPAELREILGFGETKIYRICRELPTYRFGKALRVRRRDLEQWLEDNRQEPEEGSRHE